jgi:hypothetical protein
MASNVPTPLSPVMTPRKDKQNAHVIDLSSPDPPPPSSRINPKKRLSSEHGHTFDPESPASKRTKWDSDADKENRFLGGPSAAHNANLVDMTMDDGDAVNIFSRSMVTAPVAGPSTPRHKKPVASSSNDPYVTQSSHADLKNVSVFPASDGCGIDRLGIEIPYSTQVAPRAKQEIQKQNYGSSHGLRGGFCFRP